MNEYFARATDPETSKEACLAANETASTATNRIVMAALDFPQGATCSELVNAIHGSWGSVSRHITSLVRSGKLVVIGKRMGPRGAMQRVVRGVKRNGI